MTVISELEASESVMSQVARAVREEGGAEAYRAGLDGLTAAVTERLELTSRHDADRGTALDFAASIEKGSETALREPHVLGWFHQHFGEPERAASHRAHNREEAKHDSQTATTQLYTPRWIADVLADEAVGGAGRAIGDRLPTVLDPAVGGGQFLVAAYEALSRRYTDASPAAIVGQLYGTDVDVRAVEVARRTLALYVARQVGERRTDIETTIEEQIRVADGLFDEVPTADVVLTNPPYMGSRSMPAELKTSIRNQFEPFHGDLYAAFIRRCHALAEVGLGILAQQTIWYLKRFRKAREWLLEAGDLELFVHLGAHAFASLSGE
ncbi:MAG: Eco57I restriction-modification methylase domain-containing protein, partial [Bradymonadaceae bacterium]